ncbi:hypothetical protein EZV62_000389 [Acer yangbiense]|uniref:J domain-containing protein n=1 Tax=Acer yangbiense TaxID=1000413 RepID=A0A5C7IR73_9ROSI|nr:hypothetical protein EZV62_000389 [Acer yangbiense]
MECNKEEAIRAKGIAENKMKNNDFAGARKIAVKAQQLYNDLENISQMIMVCDVHCSAEEKMLGNETDWYKILQVEQNSDEASIRKQFRKYALQLHPDKNKFPGAETAFKLIGEAHRVLLDKDKRTLHDMKVKHNASTSRPAPSYQPRNNFRSDFKGLNSQHHKQQQQQQQPTQSGTFWTMCPFCNVRYQYYRNVINTAILCQTCSKSFVAYERSVQGVPVPTATNLGKSAFYQKKDVPSTGAFKVEQVFKGNVAADNYKTVYSQKGGCSSDVGKAKMDSKKGRKQVVESSGSCGTESSSSSEAEVDMKIDENGDFQVGKNFGRHGDQNPRRSNRRKQQVSYQENLSDDDDLVNLSKRAKGSGSSGFTEKETGDASNREAPEMNKQSGSACDVKEEQKEAKQKESACFGESLPDGNKENGKVSVEETRKVAGSENKSGVHANDREKIFEAPAADYKGRSEAFADLTLDSNSEKDPESYKYNDPDFNDFEKDRKEECFAVGQTWAVYDTHDAMPRFYAQIRKVFTSGFKLRITWLEPDPDDENEIEWVNEELPVSCGKFRHGSSQNTEDRPMFSHLVSWEKGSEKNTYKIFPKKGQTWGLFKGWDINWKSDADCNQKKFEYEFVEILSDYVEGVGISVAYLAKVKGFVCVFCRSKEGTDSFHIPPGELLRFSHRVPSVKLTGEGRKDVLKDSFELDPASLPQNLEEIDVPEILKAEAGGSCLGSADKVKPSIVSEACTSGHQAEANETCLDPENGVLGHDDEHHSASQASTPEDIDIPEPEFYNFDAEKSEDKLQVGQIWSLYSDEDGLPKYYGVIVKIKKDPAFELHLRWLVSCSLPKGSIEWHDEDMPICCGRFKISKDGIQEYTSTGSFSYQVRAEPAGKKKEYNIFPSKGEIWALYQNWNAEIKCSDLENCEYDVVEILNRNELQIEVLFLDRMDDFKSVFRPRVKESSSTATMEIPLVELLRFSHQIPAFRLSEERGGTLRGFWELDPAALPVHYFLN